MAGSAAAAADVITDVDFLEQMLEEAQLRAFGGDNLRGETIEAERGIAGIQAVKLLMSVKAQLDRARAVIAEKTGVGDGSEETFVAGFVERLQNLPLPYLELAVTEYCRRHPGVRLVTE